MSEVSGGGGFKPIGTKMMGRPPQKPADERLREVSDMYEKHFLREMTKAMRSTVTESGFIKSNQAEKIFREQLDEQYVEKWGDRGGIGLSDMIYDQLISKFGAAMGISERVQKPVGPISVDGKSDFRPTPFQHPGKKQALSYKYDIPDVSGSGPVSVSGPTAGKEVKAPWDGVLLGSKKLADDQSLVEIKHDNGLKSQMVFKGSVSKDFTGQQLQAGDTLGFLSPEAKSLYWTIEPDPQPDHNTVSE